VRITRTYLVQDAMRGDAAIDVDAYLYDIVIDYERRQGTDVVGPESITWTQAGDHVWAATVVIAIRGNE
jgi:hypothetical protein